MTTANIFFCLLAVGAPPTELPAADFELFFGSAEDELDKEICVDDSVRASAKCRDELSYPTSNEQANHVFAPYIKNLGGGYVGIGAVQNFTFIHWARPELVWLLDYDPVIVFLHRAHRAFILAAETPNAYREQWNPKNRRTAVPLLRAALREFPHRKVHLDAYRKYRRRIYKFYDAKLANQAQAPNHWLAAQESYDFIRAMFAAGRIRIMQGDLLKRQALGGVAEAAAALGVPIRVVYLSNAEEFWPYNRNFRRNVRAMPMDERSVIIRTRASQKRGELLDGRFAYCVQGGLGFQTGLADRALRRVDGFLKRSHTGEDGVMRLDLSTLAWRDHSSPRGASRSNPSVTSFSMTP